MVCCCYTRRIELDWLAEYRIVELRRARRGANRCDRSLGGAERLRRAARKQGFYQQIKKSIVAVFKQSNNDDKHSHGQEKRKSTTLSWGKGKIYKKKKIVKCKNKRGKRV